MLHTIADGIWGHEKDIRLPLGMLLPSRATIVRVDDGSGALAIHSPLAIDDATAKEIDKLGEVRFIVAPNFVHWMFVGQAKERYPNARIFATPTLEKKLSGLSFEPLPEEGRVEAMGDKVIVKRIQGVPHMTEHVFLHEPSKSLIVSDLMFNVHECNGFMMKLFFRAVGAWKKTAQSRFWRFLVKDHLLAAKSAREILDLDYQRVVVAHGDVVDGDDARDRSREALAWMSKASPLLLGAGTIA